MYGFLRETEAQAKKAGIEPLSGWPRTGLDTYLKAIYPDYVFVHDSMVPAVYETFKRRFRPDYRCEELKLIVEFDGLPHYKDPVRITDDTERDIIYESCGYKVVRIPWVVQLTNDVVETLFGVTTDVELFPDVCVTMSVEDKCTPAFLCFVGIQRLCWDFLDFPDWYKVNRNYLVEYDKSSNYPSIYTGLPLLETVYVDICNRAEALGYELEVV